MGPQDASILQQQYHHFPRQSDVDFEAAEQLVQHSRRGRESNGDTTSGSALEPEASTTNFVGSSGDHGLGDELFENGNENGESHPQERHADAQYAPINNQPPLGQVCRYAQKWQSECKIVVCGRRLTNTLSVIAPLHARLSGVDRQMVRLSATLADYTQRHEIPLDQRI